MRVSPSGRERLLFVCNFEKETEIRLQESGKPVLTNSGRKHVSGRYGPYETAVFRLSGAAGEDKRSTRRYRNV